MIDSQGCLSFTDGAKTIPYETCKLANFTKLAMVAKTVSFAAPLLKMKRTKEIPIQTHAENRDDLFLGKGVGSFGWTQHAPSHFAQRSAAARSP